MCQVVIHRVAPHTDITFIPINIFFFFFFSIRRSLRETPLISLHPFVSNQLPRRLGLSRFFYPYSPLNSSRPSRQCQVLSVSFASSISRHETGMHHPSCRGGTTRASIFTRIGLKLDRLGTESTISCTPGSLQNCLDRFIASRDGGLGFERSQINNESPRPPWIDRMISERFHFHFS